MKISIEHIIELVTREVIRELTTMGVLVDGISKLQESPAVGSKALELDLSGYKTPLVSDERLLRIDREVQEIIVPANTLFTPGARDIIRKKKLTIIYKS